MPTGHYYMQDDAASAAVVGTGTLANAAFITANTSDQTASGPRAGLPNALVLGALASPYIRVNGGTRLDSNNTLQTFTLAFWLKLGANADCEILTSDANGLTRCMQYDATGQQMFMFDLNDNEDGLVIGSPTMTDWNHFAVTAEPRLGTCWLRTYVNAVQTAFQDVGSFNIESPFGIGAISTADDNNSFAMADFFWNPDVTYSAGQIRALKTGVGTGSPVAAMGVLSSAGVPMAKKLRLL